MKISGKHALVTGGAMGIGFATAMRLVGEGCRVTLWDLNEAALASASEKLTAAGGTVTTFVCDVTDKARVYKTAGETVSASGPVDILINNAGFLAAGNLLDCSDEALEKTIAINLTSLVYTVRAFLPGMHERNSGHVVNIASASGLLGVPGLAVYTATKWGVIGFTESMRFESVNAGKKGVRWSAVCPSYIATGMFEGARLAGLGRLLVPQVKNHDVIAEAVVEGALKRGRTMPKRPRTVNMTVRLRGMLPDSLFQKILVALNVHTSMSRWTGRKETSRT